MGKWVQITSIRPTKTWNMIKCRIGCVFQHAILERVLNRVSWVLKQVLDRVMYLNECSVESIECSFCSSYWVVFFISTQSMSKSEYLLSFPSCRTLMFNKLLWATHLNSSRAFKSVCQVCIGYMIKGKRVLIVVIFNLVKENMLGLVHVVRC